MAASPIQTESLPPVLTPGDDTQAFKAEPTASSRAFAGFLDVRCRVSVVLGTGSISVRDCLGLGRASVIKLAQSAGEDLHLRVGGIEIAKGEVVIIDDSTALRVTEITHGGEGDDPE